MNRFAAVVFVLLLLASPSLAQDVTRIADTSTVAPGGTATFTSFGRPVIDGSMVAFTATVGNATGIYEWSGGVISTLVPPAAPIPNGIGNFTSYGTSVGFQNGTVAFYGSGNGQAGIYSAKGTTIARFADLNTPIPGGAGDFTSLGGPSLSGGTLAFTGFGSSSQGGVYVSTGGDPPAVRLVADGNTTAPNGGGETFGYNSYASPVVSGQSVVFAAGSGFYQRIGTGPVTTVADYTTPVPGGTGNFIPAFFHTASMSGTNVAFINEYNGVYARINGTLTRIADPSTPSPNGGGKFTGFAAWPNSPSAAISGNEVAFVADIPNALGLYLYDGSALHTLLYETPYGNPMLDGQSLYLGVPFLLSPGAINGSQVAFEALFGTAGDPPEPTSSGIYLATYNPVPEPGTLAMTGIAALVLIRRCRRSISHFRGSRVR